MIQFTGSGELPDIPEDLSPVMKQVSELMLDSVRLNFYAGGRPEAWDALKSGYPSFLFQTGALLRSIQSGFGPDSAEVGTNTFYAPFLQFGTSKMSERPFLLFQPDDVEQILLMVDKFLFGKTVKFGTAQRETQ